MKSKGLGLVYLIVFIDLLGFGIIIPLLPYYVSNLGANGLVATSMLTIYSFMQFIFCPIWGRLSDKYGRKPILFISLVGSVISYGLYGIAFLISANNEIVLLILFLSRMLAGIMGANISTAYAYIADVVEEKDRANAMGKVGAAFGLGFILGPAIGSITNQFGGAAPGFVAAGVCLIAAILTIYILPESANKTLVTEGLTVKSIKEIFSTKGFALIIFASFIYSIAFSIMDAIFGLFASGRYNLDGGQIGFIFAYLGVIIALSQGILVGKAISRLGEYRLIILGAIGMCFCFFTLTFTYSIWTMILLMGGIALTAGAINPILPAVVSNFSNNHMQGMAQGVFQSVLSLARIIGPIMAGALYMAYGDGFPFLLGGCLLLLVLIILIMISSKKQAVMAN